MYNICGAKQSLCSARLYVDLVRSAFIGLTLCGLLLIAVSAGYRPFRSLRGVAFSPLARAATPSVIAITTSTTATHNLPLPPPPPSHTPSPSRLFASQQQPVQPVSAPHPSPHNTLEQTRTHTTLGLSSRAALHYLERYRSFRFQSFNQSIYLSSTHPSINQSIIAARY
jgi:hypothetical protein